MPRAKHLAVITKLSFNSAVHSRPFRDLIQPGRVVPKFAQPARALERSSFILGIPPGEKERLGEGRQQRFVGSWNVELSGKTGTAINVIDEREAPLTICRSPLRGDITISATIPARLHVYLCACLNSFRDRRYFANETARKDPNRGTDVSEAPFDNSMEDPRNFWSWAMF